MAYLIVDIKNVSPDAYPLYFFDANPWIAALKSFGSLSLDKHEVPYVFFFEAIVALHAHKGTTMEKKVAHFPKFVMTSLLLSEIINAFMRNVAMKVFYESQGKNHTAYNFKKDYRKQPDYLLQLKSLKSDFEAFKDYVVLYDDEFKEVDPYTILPTVDESNDFNDVYYYYFFQGKNIPIVTHDSDFIFQDLPIITSQRDLLGLTK